MGIVSLQQALLHDARVFGSSSMYHRGQDDTLLPGWTEPVKGLDVPPLTLTLGNEALS